MKIRVCSVFIRKQRYINMQKSTLMTEGSITKKILLFALPLIIGNIFQQLYSGVDAAIVGKVISADALAAVGAGASLLDMLLGFSVGISAGAGVLIAQFYGMQDEKKVRTTVHVSILVAFAMGLFLTVFGIAFIPQIYTWMKTPQYIMADAVLYMRIYFASMIFVTLYNMFAGILNAVGNSKWPLYFLVISSIVNIILDYLFVVVLRYGIVGAAVATDVSQALSCVLCLIYLLKVKDMYRVSFAYFHMDTFVLGQIISTSLPTGIQNTIKAFSNVLIQAGVNFFGATAMAGYTAFLKIDGFNWLPVMSLSMAAATFTGQNLGAGKTERIKKGVWICVGMGMVYTFLTAVISMAMPRQLLGIFTAEAKVIDYGLICLYLFMPFYWMLSTFQIVLGAVRGAGHTFASLILNSTAMVLFRIIYISVVMKHFTSFTAVIAIYPFSWLLGMIISLVYFIRKKMPEKFYF